MKRFNVIRQFLVIVVVIVILAAVYNLSLGNQYQQYQLNLTEFTQELNEGNINMVELKPNTDGAVYEVTGSLNSYSTGEEFTTLLPFSDVILNEVTDTAIINGVKVEVKKQESMSFLAQSLFSIVPFLLIGMMLIYFLSRNANGAGRAMEFGKSRAKLYENKKKLTFDDVAGLNEEKQEVEELVDFLKVPKKYQKMGARIPKGVLLVGPPGTGKTLLARSIAGEAGVPFYSISGSDFVEMFVGVGASRVRDMFKQAKQTAPCLVFIDEIDAVGRQRGAGMGGGHDEREQTLNQLLVEMDGFGDNEGIIIMAATNRPDVLDPALLRPGRFDRRIQVDMPKKDAREAILHVHARNKTFSDQVEFKHIAERTYGFSGADLENLLNEAAILAVRENRNKITMDDIDEAADRVLMGPAKKSNKYTDKERRMVAYHEAGHAVVGIKLKDASEVHKITIVPRGRAGGYNLMLPREEKFTTSKTELLQQISGYMGGRAAEELVFGEISSGAYGDIESSTRIARAMVTEYGMSDLGPIQYEQSTGNVFLGRDYNKNKNFSDTVAHEIDTEVRKIIAECYDEAVSIISANRDLLDLIVEALLENETITKEQIEHLVEHGKMPEKEVVQEEVEEIVEVAEETVEEETDTDSEENKDNEKKLVN